MPISYKVGLSMLYGIFTACLDSRIYFRFFGSCVSGSMNSCLKPGSQSLKAVAAWYGVTERLGTWDGREGAGHSHRI